jgi:hypothetical protein
VYPKGNNMKKFKLLFIVFIFSITISSCSFDYYAISPQNVFKNKNFAWCSDSTQHIKYYFASNSRVSKDIDTIKEKSERYITHILMLIHEDNYLQKISMIFTESRLKMKELTNLESNGLANPKYNAVYYVYGDSLRVNGEHEFNHVIVTNLWGNNHISRWLAEGFAVFSDDLWWSKPLHLLNKYFIDKGIFVSLPELQSNFNKHSDLITYPESGSFVKYLYEKYGYQKIKRLWQQGEDEVESIYGKSFDELEKEWVDVIKSYDAKGIKYKL